MPLGPRAASLQVRVSPGSGGASAPAGVTRAGSPSRHGALRHQRIRVPWPPPCFSSVRASAVKRVERGPWFVPGTRTQGPGMPCNLRSSPLHLRWTNRGRGRSRGSVGGCYRWDKSTSAEFRGTGRSSTRRGQDPRDPNRWRDAAAVRGSESEAYGRVDGRSGAACLSRLARRAPHGLLQRVRLWSSDCRRKPTRPGQVEHDHSTRTLCIPRLAARAACVLLSDVMRGRSSHTLQTGAEADALYQNVT